MYEYWMLTCIWYLSEFFVLYFSGTSMHPVEATLYYSAGVLPALLGFHPVLALGCIADCAFGAWLGHDGFQVWKCGIFVNESDFRPFFVCQSKDPCTVATRLKSISVICIQAFLDFCGFDFRGFRFTAVYNSILFFSPLVLLSNLDLWSFCFCIFLCVCVPTLIS